jgi:AmmeMemoRadiSam system protein B
VRRFGALKPKLREIEAHPILHEGQPMMLLRDPLRLSDVQIAIPRPLGNLLALMDGTRDEAALEAALQVRAGVRLAPGLLSRLLADLDEGCLLDNERSAEAKAAALQAYREAPFRPPMLDGASLPADPEQASAHLQAYVEVLSDAGSPTGGTPTGGSIRGLISPHIDYQRGGLVYAEVWQAAAQAAREAELAIVFGTDHQGGNGTLTLTRQSYATAWGALPTDLEVVDALAASLGAKAAFAEELHHRGEHSIELAAVWLHFIREGRPVPLVPILCGSFGGFVEGQGDPATHAPFAAALDVLREVMASRRTLVVAAADLAHMGPAFGHPYGLDYIGRARLRNADQRLLQTVYDGDAAAFFEMLKAEGDRRHVCGLPPIYLTLRLLGEANGEPAGYDLCPADPQGTSFVSIAGVILR